MPLFALAPLIVTHLGLATATLAASPLDAANDPTSSPAEAAAVLSASHSGQPTPRHVPLPLLLKSPFAVQGPLPPPPSGVADLKFADFFVTPVGPRGLVPTARLRMLDGQRVRVVGFMAQQESPTTGLLLLTPRPVPIAEIEDGMADDLPPQVVFVHAAVASASQRPLSYHAGLLQFTGTLQVGAQEEADGRVSLVRLLLDAATSAALVQLDRDADAMRP